MANEQDRNVDRDRNSSRDGLDQSSRSDRAGYKAQPHSPDSDVDGSSVDGSTDRNIDEGSGMDAERSSRERNSSRTDAG